MEVMGCVTFSAPFFPFSRLSPKRPFMCQHKLILSCYLSYLILSSHSFIFYLYLLNSLTTHIRIGRSICLFLDIRYKRVIIAGNRRIPRYLPVPTLYPSENVLHRLPLLVLLPDQSFPILSRLLRGQPQPPLRQPSLVLSDHLVTLIIHIVIDGNQNATRPQDERRLDRQGLDRKSVV